MAVVSKGEYGVPEGLIFSFPVTIKDGVWSIVEGIELNDFSKEKIAATADELVGEREGSRTFAWLRIFIPKWFRSVTRSKPFNLNHSPIFPDKLSQTLMESPMRWLALTLFIGCNPENSLSELKDPVDNWGW